VRNLCIFPVLALLVAFNIFPLITSLYISFHDYEPGYDPSLGHAKFVGLDNYRENLDNPDNPKRQPAWESFQRTAGLVAVTVSAETLLGFGVAMLLHRKFPGRGIITALLLIPMTLSPAVVASFWKYMFNADFGVINWLIHSNVPWNGLSDRAFWSVVIVEVWIWTPFMMLLSLAGLNAIPQSLYEAAEVDRASAWFRFRNITLPLVMPMVLLGVIFRAMDTFRIFDTAFVLNNAQENQNTTFVSVLLYLRGIKNASDNLGTGTALAYLLLIVAVALGNVAVYYLTRMRSGGKTA
jgi:multiple sugar transport system permease protein